MWTFIPIYKRTVWGGSRIAAFKGLALPESHIGECWAISGLEEAESVVGDGPEKGLTISALIDRYGAALMGKDNYQRYGNRFPLIVKLLDTDDDLSVQVHPDDELAREQGLSNGKTEMWYVLDACPGARIANGFRHHLTRDEVRRHTLDHTIANFLAYTEVKPGDLFFIPAGQVHTAGAGCLMLEIQQTSDVTYRLYDYDRRDLNGWPRELHTDLAIKAVNPAMAGGALRYNRLGGARVGLVSSRHFTTERLALNGKYCLDLRDIDSFVLLTSTRGRMRIRCGNEEAMLTPGSLVLLPASEAEAVITPSDASAEIIITYIV